MTTFVTHLENLIHGINLFELLKLYLQNQTFSNRMPYHRQSTYAAIDLDDNEFIDQQNIADDIDYIPEQQHGNFERKNCTPNYTYTK